MTAIAPLEQDAWERFLLFMRVDDVWHVPSFARRPSSLDFSWGLRRQQGRLFEWLDRFYVGEWASLLGGSTCICPSTSMSDNSVVSLFIILERPNASHRGSRIPDRLLSSGDLPDHLAQILGADPVLQDTEALHLHAEFLATCIQASSVACRQTASDCRREAAQRERSLLAPLTSV